MEDMMKAIFFFVEKYMSNVCRVGSKVDMYLHNNIRTSNKFLYKLINKTIYEKLIPDRYITWFHSAVNKSKDIIKKHGIDLVFASIGGLKTNAVVAWRAGLCTGVPVMIDYRDPWTLSNFIKDGVVRKKLNCALEKRILENTCRISTSSAYMKELFVENGYFNADGTDVILTGHDEELQHIVNNNEKVDIQSEKINITYAGTFYGDRQPDSFIEAISSLVGEDPAMGKMIVVNIIGNFDDKRIAELCRKKNVESMFRFMPQMSYKACMKYLLESDVQLLINGVDPANRIYLPAKIYDYLATKQPVLFIGNGGAPADVIADVNIGVSATHDPDDIKQKLLQLLKEKSSRKINLTKLHEYSAQRMAEKFAASFAKVIVGQCAG